MSSPPDALPERVRARVVTYAADALGALPAEQVPASLKKLASFTPRRRARLAGAQILELIEQDDDFRRHLAVQARAQQPDAVAALESGEASVGAAALAVLDRSEGWEELLERAAEAEASGQAAAEVENVVAELARARAQIATTQEEATARVRKARDEQDRLRADNAELRRKLGESRAGARAAEAAATEAREALERIREETAVELARGEARWRRLRGQMDALEGELARLQRSSRAARDEGTMRARLLLDSLIAAGEGLRKELGLPVVEGSPADSVAAELGESGSRESTATRSMRSDDPTLVQQLLAIPGMHLVIDGYNVTMSVWGQSSLEIQRSRLLAGIAPLAARSGAEITVVFDGHSAEQRPRVQAPRGVRVLFSPHGRIADDLIRDLVAAEPPGRTVGVVTSDQEIVADVTRQSGVRAIPSAALAALISRAV